MEEKENLKTYVYRWLGQLGREERYRTVISGMEPRRIAEVMLLPRDEAWRRGSKLVQGFSSVNTKWIEHRNSLSKELTTADGETPSRPRTIANSLVDSAAASV